MHVLVLGGTRFIGAAAVRALVADGHAVTCVHRGQSQAALPDAVDHVHLDHAELPARLDALGGPFDALLDMRPLGEASAQRTVDVGRKLDVGRLVAISSCDVYLAYGRLIGHEPGPPTPTPVPEDGALRGKPYPYRGASLRADDDPERWKDDYDKILAERVFEAAPIPSTVLRLPMVHGPDDYQHRFAAWIRRMLDQRPAIVLPASLAAWRTCRADVAEVGRAIALATTDPRAADRVYNVSQPEPPTEQTWIADVAQVLGWTGELVVVPDAELPEALRPGLLPGQDLTVDTRRIRSELGYAEQLDRLEGLRQTVAWEREHLPESIPGLDYDAEDEVLASRG